ncbi:LysE family translocator [Dietzia sp. ANT_WB102]|uniref:LysE family translocator n=1 Tax=Dietzia sp. ANT_WB102 TaxID=2597345 RepID=UPI0011EE7D5B|nr:LysE family transporter [Dietzia sp. ANT_WB102]KAA0918211.1 LysE family translocator [Dietzia sp. ANT_WB102]
MTAAQLLGLFGVWAIAVISPGPDVVVVLQRALAGRRQGLATALGIVTGLSVWLAAAFAGVATLVRVYPQVMTGLQVAGGILLAALGLLGLRGWWESRAGRADDAGHAASTPPQAPPRADFTRGLATNLANPKALVFFGAVLTPFLRGGSPVAASVAIVAGMIVVALVWFGGLALVASHRVVNERMGRLLPWIDVVASVLFVGVGVAFVIGALARVGAG